MKLLKRSLFVIGILLLVVYCFACWTLSGRVLFPVSSLEKTKSRIIQYWGTTYEDVMATLPEPSDFKVKTKDGLELNGKYFTNSDSSTCIIIFAHGWGAMWADMTKYAPVFDDCNCDFVFYDHRVHGSSEGTYATGGLKEAEDLWKVTEWVQENKNIALENIGWIGSSWGAATSIIGASDEKNVGFIIADSPFQNWYSAIFERAIRDYGSGIKLLASGVMSVVNMRSGVDYKDASPINKMNTVEEPVLLIHSQGDTQTSSQQSVNISEKLKENARFYHTQWGNDHVMDVVKNTAEYKSYVNAFLLEEAPQFLKEVAVEESEN